MTADRGRGPSPLSLADVARAREAAYWLFSALFLYPDTARWQRVLQMGGDLRPLGDDLARFGFFGPWQHLLETLAALDPGDITALQAEHVRLFNVDANGALCQPHEASYTPSGLRDAGWIVLQLQQVYARGGLSLAPSLNERPDHLSVELEYASYLCGQEADAWARAVPSDAVRFLRQEHAFLHLHLGRWLGAFVRDFARMAGQRLYATAAVALDAFVHHDHDLVTLLAVEAERLRHRADASRPLRTSTARASA